MLHTITSLSVKTGTSQKSGKDYAIMNISTNKQPNTMTSFYTEEMKNWKVGDTVDILCKEEDYNGNSQWKFTVNDSLEGKLWRIGSLVEKLTFDMEAVKVALQISTPEAKPRAYKTEAQATAQKAVEAKVEKDLEDVNVENLPF